MDTPSETLSRISTGIFHANGLLTAWGDRFAADLGLTSSRWQMLGALAQAAAPQTSPQLGERMGMSRQGAQKQLNLLLADGLVAAADNPAHKRSPLYSLTADGAALYEKIHLRWMRQAEEWTADLDAEELAAAENVLRKLAEKVKAAG
ncbi:Multiple antibiotic resistance protein marR [Kingella potus]|uniref:Multiple antibiotic resistance protein marR n=1 Tax=Kingella potus TaxID=265175 RepID=A0A377R298_9NEIS|nr:MarR family winged helix-turn-helix transcriptional regulator [Kingella potus]UOP00324.1 MarR family winged helix-turn-helix transcriptional regulator [Kingella potus]STR02616.1 Multiple antibiotic resistance protein marR [Kingella potus]